MLALASRKSVERRDIIPLLVRLKPEDHCLISQLVPLSQHLIYNSHPVMRLFLIVTHYSVTSRTTQSRVQEFVPGFRSSLVRATASWEQFLRQNAILRERTKYEMWSGQLFVFGVCLTTSFANCRTLINSMWATVFPRTLTSRFPSSVDDTNSRHRSSYVSIQQSSETLIRAGARVGSTNRSLLSSFILYQGPMYPARGLICPHHLLLGQLEPTLDSLPQNHGSQSSLICPS